MYNQCITNSTNIEKKVKYNKHLKNKCMTLIIGIRCKDGVVLAGDKKVIRGRVSSEEKKISVPFNGFVVGYSGLTALLDKFVSKINEYLYEEEDKTWSDFVPRLEDSVIDISDRYKDRLEERGLDAELEVLYCAKMATDHVTLNYISNDGISEEIKRFLMIGCGRPYALPFLKSLYYPEITMTEAIKLCVFVLQLMDNLDVDIYVGGKPQVVKIPDDGELIELPDQEIEMLLKETAPVCELKNFIKLSELC